MRRLCVTPEKKALILVTALMLGFGLAAARPWAGASGEGWVGMVVYAVSVLALGGALDLFYRGKR